MEKVRGLGLVCRRCGELFLLFFGVVLDIKMLDLLGW